MTSANDGNATNPSVGRLYDELQLSDRRLRQLAPPGLDPTDEQIEWVKRWILREPGLTRKHVAVEMGIHYDRMYAWYRRSAFGEWVDVVEMFAAGAVGVPRGWRAMAERAADGDCRAMHMLALRYDSTYRAAYNKEPMAQVAEAPQDAELEAAGRVLLPSGVVTPGLHDVHDAAEPDHAPDHAPDPGGRGNAPPPSIIGPIPPSSEDTE